MQKQIHYRVSGEPDAPAVLLIHGWMASGRVWDSLLPLLVDEYRLIVPDLRGTGASPAFAGPVSLAAYVHDLQQLCDDLALADCHLLGHSMGGQLAALLAAAQPQHFQSVTLMNPVPIQGLPLPDDLQGLFRDSGGKPDALGRILDMACLSLATADREQLLNAAKDIAPQVISEGFDAWMRGEPDASLDTLTMPATVIATDDPFLPADFLETAVVSNLPDAQLKHLPGPGHYPQVEAPEACAKLLKGTWQ